MDKHMKYLHRDVSWMYFNHRILQEAQKETVPLLERLSFLGIYSNNLDEFFRVRVASISRIAEYDDKNAREEYKEARALLKAINKLNNVYSKEYQETVENVTACLRKEGICLVNEKEIDAEQQAYVHDFFRRELNGHLAPIWLDSVKRFDDEADDCIYLAVKLSREGVKRNYYALLPLPVSRVGRFVRLPDRGGRSYLMYLDDVVRCCLPLLFPGLHFDHYEAYSFKFTKDAEMEIDNDLRNGLLQKISKGVKSRRLGLPLRLIYDGAMPAGMLRRVMNKLDNERLDTALAGGKYQNHRDLMGFPDCGRKDLKYPAWPSILRHELAGAESLFDLIRQRDRFLHVPYHSFDSYIRLLQEAAINPAVKSVKTTLYRLAKDSKVVKALISAARNGKKVTVVIELLARFDEASNISWSKRMHPRHLRRRRPQSALQDHAHRFQERVRHRLHQHGQLPRRQRPRLHRLPAHDSQPGHRTGRRPCIPLHRAPLLAHQVPRAPRLAQRNEKTLPAPDRCGNKEPPRRPAFGY